MIKALIGAMFIAGTALFLAALLWPVRPPRRGQEHQHHQPTANAIEASNVALVEERAKVSTTPAQPAAPAIAEPQPTQPLAQQIDFAPLVPSSASSPAPARDSALDPAADPNLTRNEQLTYKQTGTDDTSLRNPDFPRTYISKIHVDLTSPDHWVTLTWAGPEARLHPTTKYHCSPGRGLGNNNCDDPAESCRVDSNCTPKGTHHVQAFSNSMEGSPEVRFVTWFDTKRGIALHFYPFVPNYPASHGCVRLGDYAAQLIHNNSKIGETEVVVDGKWTFAR